MPSFQIGVSVGQLIPDGSPLGRDAFPHLARAVERMAQRTEALWKAYASNNVPLPGGRVPDHDGTYLQSIMTRATGDFSAEVYSEHRRAQQIESGFPARDLKKMLWTSFKVRLSEDGRRYLIIPIRWDTPGSVKGANHMTQAVHDWWKDQEPSHVVSSHTRDTGTGAYDIKTRRVLQVPAWTYKWGTRLTEDDALRMGATASQAQRMAGMVNFRAPGKVGGAAHSQHITFRVMAEGSSGWVVPPKAGLWPARTTAQKMEPAIRAAFQEAVRRDVARIVRGS